MDFVRENFIRFNNLIFNNSLAIPRLRTGTSRRTLGSLAFIKSISAGQPVFSNFTLTISKRLNLAAEVIEDTIIHEMIHLYIFSNNIKDTSSHGRHFRRIMNFINITYGRNICISHHTTEEEIASDRRKSSHYLILTRFKNGETFITSCARTRIFQLHRQLSMHTEVDSWEWRYSTNSWFDRFPRSTTLKFYKISSQTLSHFNDAIPCICDGNRFQPAFQSCAQPIPHTPSS